MLAAAQRGVRCFTYTPQAIKMAVCGSGAAGKEQVQRMVGTLLGLPEPPTPDHAADALAVAICHGGGTGRQAAVGGRGRGGAGREAGGMIAAVRGEVMVRRPDHVVIDAGGVGYRLAVSSETLKAVPATGREAFLHAELISREDSLALFGFASEEERDLFGELISVSGVGPKVAIAALSGGPARELLRAIAAGDAKRFQAVPGIGKRTSERIIVELREKVAGALEEEVALVGGDGERRPRPRPRRPGQPRLRAAGGRAAARRDRERGRRGADRRRPAQGRVLAEQGMSEIGPNRIRTPGIDGLPEAEDVRVHDARADVPDEDLDRSLRPRRLADFVNQAQVTDQLAIFIEAARGRDEPLDHVLLAGPPGLGKTSLAHIVAEEMGVPMVQTAGPGAGAQGRCRLLPHRAGAGQRLLRRRDPPARPGGRGDALPGDGGR